MKSNDFSTRANRSLRFPAPPRCTSEPVWTVSGFIFDGEQNILTYSLGDSGWTDNLTDLHEDLAADEHYIDGASRGHALASLYRLLLFFYGESYDHGHRLFIRLYAPMLNDNFKNATIIGADYVRAPLEQLSRSLPAVPLLHFNLVTCQLPDRSVNAVVLLNVLEHIEKDTAAIRQIAGVLKPDGVAVIEVPAGPNIPNIYDAHLMRYRRYRMRELTAKLKASGLHPIERSHLRLFLYPAFWISKKWGRGLITKPIDDQKRKLLRGLNWQSQAALCI